MPRTSRPDRARASILTLVAAMSAGFGSPPGDDPPARTIDATTLRRKVLCGYQGWFRCPGDPAGVGWRHWSRDASKIAPDTLTFEMWPDLADFDDDEKYPAPGFAHPDGRPVHLFSSAHPRTVRRHFEWMKQYAIDGVFVQRFLVGLDDPSLDQVLSHVRASAAATGRAYAIGYDLTGTPEDRLVDRLAADWKRLIDDLQVTADARHLRHDGKPVVFVWGLYPDRFGPATAHRIIDIFEDEGPYRATVIGGVPWSWRSEHDAEWARAFRRLDLISPWNVGNYVEVDGRRQAATGTWEADRDEAERSGMEYLPVIYPGFGWTNLQGEGAAGQTIPRLGGEFYWRQFSRAADLGLDMAYVAMFDEVDEATAIFKVSNSPPIQAPFATFEGLPSDWYLRLTGEGSRLIRGERANSKAPPIRLTAGSAGAPQGRTTPSIGRKSPPSASRNPGGRRRTFRRARRSAAAGGCGPGRPDSTRRCRPTRRCRGPCRRRR